MEWQKSLKQQRPSEMSWILQNRFPRYLQSLQWILQGSMLCQQIQTQETTSQSVAFPLADPDFHACHPNLAIKFTVQSVVGGFNFLKLGSFFILKMTPADLNIFRGIESTN